MAGNDTILAIFGMALLNVGWLVSAMRLLTIRRESSMAVREA